VGFAAMLWGGEASGTSSFGCLQSGVASGTREPFFQAIDLASFFRK
jgi:hypothetical protein